MKYALMVLVAMLAAGCNNPADPEVVSEVIRLEAHNITRPAAGLAFRVGDSIRLEARAISPLANVSLCYAFERARPIPGAESESSCGQDLSQARLTGSVWSIRYPFSPDLAGSWSSWIRIGNRESNKINYVVVP